MNIHYQRRALGALIWVARIVGVLLIALAILQLPWMRPLVGRFADLFGFAGSIALLLAGLAWFFTIGMLIRFFDDYLSRN